jgi:MiaB/RimO family radical SAM methylthiotransferase
LAEARALVESGHKEIVLTGINLGAYGKETVRKKRWEGGKNPAFADLLGKLAGVEGLERIRLSSLEPADVTDDLLEVMSGNENIMPHLHLPLQSGSDAVLKRMCRQYRLGDFMRVVEKIKGAIDRPAITTDIIVGFPGETDEDFERTLEAAREVHFSKIHVFSYSNRKGTPAEKLGRKVKSQVIKSRSQRLNELGRELAESYRGKLGGVEETVLVETVRPARGRCSRYFMVELPGGKTYRKGDVVRTVI